MSLVRCGPACRGEEPLGVRDDRGHVPALKKVGTEERAADAEPYDTGAEVIRDLFELDVPGRDEREIGERATYVRDEVRSADRRDRVHLDEVGTKLRGPDHLRRRHRS